MHSRSLPTAYARLTPRQARAALGLLVATCVFFVAVTLSPLRQGNAEKKQPGAGDAALYRAEIERIRAGEGYYEAAAAELTARGYTTRSVFNWRMPLPMWLVGHLPDPALGKALLGALSLALMLVSFEALAREENDALGRPVGCALLLTGPLMLCILGDHFVMPVLWSGVLIALSICAYGIGRPRWGVTAGLAALMVRELALPYCLLALVLAAWYRRRGELMAWTLGLAAWLGFFAWHWYRVTPLIAPDARGHAEGWLQFGGAGFVIATAQVNAYLLLLPQWGTALYLAAALFGLAGWQTPLGQRFALTASLYVVAFAFVGHEFNQYWGAMMGPLLCFGVVRLPASLREACRAPAGLLFPQR